MTLSLISNLYFSVFILALIVLVDVYIKFKKWTALKFFFLILPISIGITALINSFTAIEYVYFIPFFKSSMGISLLNIFSILYFPKFRKLILLFTIAILLFITFLILVNKGIIGRSPFTERFRTVSVDAHLNVKITTTIRLIRYSIMIIVGIIISYFWYVIYYKVNLNNVYFEKIKTWTTSLFLLSCIVLIVNIVIVLISKREFWTNSLTIFISFSVLLLVLMRPSFLNISAHKVALGHKFNIELEPEVDVFDFIKFFEEERYFANKEATLEGLAKLLFVSSTKLSEFINKKYDMTFSDLVNKSRVNYFIEIVQNPAYHNFTIDALAKEVGFSSRQHLNKPFKKFHGGNPSDLFESFIISN